KRSINSSVSATAPRVQHSTWTPTLLHPPGSAGGISRLAGETRRNSVWPFGVRRLVHPELGRAAAFARDRSPADPDSMHDLYQAGNQSPAEGRSPFNPKRLLLLGNYLSGLSMEDCVSRTQREYERMAASL